MRARDLPTSYQSAAAYLGKKESRPGGNNTRVVRRGPDAIAIRLHATDVVTFYADGSALLNTGGWETVTTGQRMRDCGFPVYGVGGLTYNSPYGCVSIGYGLLILPDGVAVNPHDRSPRLPKDPGWLPHGDCIEAKERRAIRRRMFRAIRAEDFPAYLSECPEEWQGRIAAHWLAYAVRRQEEEAA